MCVFQSLIKEGSVDPSLLRESLKIETKSKQYLVLLFFNFYFKKCYRMNLNKKTD